MNVHELAQNKIHRPKIEQWLETTPTTPTTLCTAPDVKFLYEFKQWVWLHNDTAVLLPPATPTSDLLTLCGTAWLDFQKIRAFLPIINNVRSGRRALTLSSLLVLGDDDSKKILNEELEDVDEIVLILHVGQDQMCCTQISSPSLSGNHWALLSNSTTRQDSFCTSWRRWWKSQMPKWMYGELSNQNMR